MNRVMRHKFFTSPPPEKCRRPYDCEYNISKCIGNVGFNPLSNIRFVPTEDRLITTIEAHCKKCYQWNKFRIVIYNND